LGVAFQISDDLLDILGSEAETGKSLGSDFRKQKLTLRLIRLLQQSDEPHANRIRELLTHSGIGGWAELATDLLQSDAVDYARSRADDFSGRARQTLQDLLDSPDRQILEAITEFATLRTF